ncbi:MAG: acyl-CoA thioesterase [Thermoplasmatota archaeon]
MEPNDTLIEMDFRANTYDIDFAGVMSNQVYPRWLEDMRTALLDGYEDIKVLWEKGSVPVLAHIEIDFKRPVFLLERIRGRMWVDELQGVKWSVRAEFVKEDGTVCARSRQWGVFVDRHTLRPVQAPEVLPRVVPGKD